MGIVADWVLLLRLAVDWWEWKRLSFSFLNNIDLLILINTTCWFSLTLFIEIIDSRWMRFKVNFLSYRGDVSRVILILFYYLYIPAKHPYILRPYKYIHPHTHYLSLTWECWNINKLCQEYLYLCIHLCINRYRCPSASPQIFYKYGLPYLEPGKSLLIMILISTPRGTIKILICQEYKYLLSAYQDLGCRGGKAKQRA